MKLPVKTFSTFGILILSTFVQGCGDIFDCPDKFNYLLSGESSVQVGSKITLNGQTSPDNCFGSDTYNESWTAAHMSRTSYSWTVSPEGCGKVKFVNGSAEFTGLVAGKCQLTITKEDQKGSAFKEISVE